MKFLKKNQINFRNVKDDSIAIQITKEVTMDTPNALRLPKGTTSQRPGGVDSINTESLGQIRYNTTTNELEVWQGQGGRQAWRALRYKESTNIVQQSLGAGDEIERFFGPLNPAPPTSDKVDDKSLWGGQNLLVFVENVPQLYDANYTIIQNPCRFTATNISFVSNSVTKTATGTGGSFTLTVSNSTGIELGQQVTGTNVPLLTYVDNIVGTTITLTKSLSGAASGNYIFSNNYISSSNAAITNFVDRGFYIGQTITVSGALNPDNNGTVIIRYITSTRIVTDDTLSNEPAGQSITIVGNSSATGPLAGAAYPTTNGAGDPAYYIRFEEPVPIGTIDPKIVRVLHGFDR